MDEKKREQYLSLLKWGMMIAGIAEIVLAVLGYLGKTYVMMGFMGVEGLTKIILGAALSQILKKEAPDPLNEHHEEDFQ